MQSRPPAPTDEASCAYVLRLQKLHQRSPAAGGFAVQGTLRDLWRALLVTQLVVLGAVIPHLTGGNRGCRSTSHNAQDSCPASTLISFFLRSISKKTQLLEDDHSTVTRWPLPHQDLSFQKEFLKPQRLLLNRLFLTYGLRLESLKCTSTTAEY